MRRICLFFSKVADKAEKVCVNLIFGWICVSKLLGHLGIYAGLEYICTRIRTPMNLSDKYDLISVAYRSRLLFRADAEYRNALGVSFETVANNRDSERAIDIYFRILANEAAKIVDEPMEDIVRVYTEASEFYLSLDWGDRSQLASRRKFCRMLFRLYATGGKRLSPGEIFKFKIKDDDDRLLRSFFPDGTEAMPSVDIRMIVLFAFGVLRPFTRNSRGRDIRDKETVASLERLNGLVEVLKDDIPRLGSTEKPLAFDECLDMLASYLNDTDSLDDCTPIWMWSLLISLTRACRSLVDAGRLRTEGEQLCALHMYGIWIDDADRGKTRFWIFPDNNMLSFCYEYDGMMWKLRPYEFKVRFADKPDYLDTFILVSSNGHLKNILSPDEVIEPDQFCIGFVEGEFDEVTGQIKRLVFTDESRRFPDWFEWRTWERLSPDDAMYERFHALLRDLYNPKSPSSMFFKNTAPEMIDRYNNLVGRDNKYLYVYDWQPRRWVIRERGTDTFIYEVAPGEELPAEALFELEISEKNPLYAIPVDIERKNYGCLELDRFAEILSDAENIGEVYVVYSDRLPIPRLGFPMYSLTVGLDMKILGKLGVLKFTESPFVWKPV